MIRPSLDGLTEPERRRALLDAFGVPGYDGRLYILGSFARRVTFYSQQVRALNLVDALCDSGRVTRRGEVAVIGAGIAGMTAAAGLLRRGARVCIFEKDADPAKKEGRMPLQQGSGQRVVHPNIYDWPASAALEPEAKDVLLTWEADRAQKVVRQMGERFETIVSEGDNKDRLRLIHAKDVAIERGTAAIISGGACQAFDVVILAVGFGIEGETTGWHSYWTDDNIDSVKTKGTWLISGSGDGALTDLMRLAITQFDHKAFLEKYGQAVSPEGQQRLDQAEREGWPPEKLVELYESVAATVNFDDELRDNKIWLNCTKEALYSPRASILNRLIAAILLRDPKINLVPKPATLKNPPEKRETGFVVTPEVMEGPEPFVFTNVITRHGPARAVELDFPDVWKDADDQFKSWQALAPAADWTRTRLWRDGAFEPGTMVPLPPDVTRTTRCLVVVSEQADAETVVQTVEQALRRSLDNPPAGIPPIDPEPIVIVVERVLADPAWYAYAVRALCACQLAVFDVTETRPGTALLLGIRAAVRRGVTVTVLRDSLNAATWAKLPFNIREVGVVSDISKEEAFIEGVRTALMNGVELLASIGDSYRDLPVYDAVRRLGTNPDFFVPVPPTERVLLLSWYSASYVEKSVGQRVESSLRTAFKEKGRTAQQVLRIIDNPSPQLVSDKLYAEIRRDRYLVADWTGWRFNVFFELGVRLAVSPDEPVNVICGDPAWLTASGVEVPAEGKQEQVVRELLGPFAFTKNIPSFNAYLGACLEAFLDTKNPWPDSGSPRRIPVRYTYDLVVSTIDLAGELWGTPAWKRLQTTGKEILGAAENKDAVSPLLFGDRHPGKRHERAGVDHLVASWLFLDDRVNHGGADLAPEREDLAERLYSILDNLGLLEQPEYKHIAQRLEEFLP